MKVIFCDNSLREMLNFRGDVIDHFFNKGYSIALIAPNNLKENGLDDMIKVYSVALARSGMNPIKDLFYMLRLIRIYRTEKPNIIFHYTIKPNIYGTLAAKFCGIPSVAMITGLGYAFSHGGVKAKIARALYRFAMRFPHRIFVLNETIQNTVINMNVVSNDKIILLSGGEGINLELFQ